MCVGFSSQCKSVAVFALLICVCVCVCLSVCLCVCLSVSVCVCVQLDGSNTEGGEVRVRLFVYLSVCLPVCQIFIFHIYELLQAIDTKVRYISIRPIRVSKKLST